VMLKSFAMGAANAEQAPVSNSSNVSSKVEMTANVELTSVV